MARISFQYIGQQREMNYFTGETELTGGRNVVVLIQAKTLDECDEASNLFVEKMTARGWKNWSGFGGEGQLRGYEGTSYWHPVCDPEEAEDLKRDYKEVKKEISASL